MCGNTIAGANMQALLMTIWALAISTSGAAINSVQPADKQNNGDYSFRNMVDAWTESGVVTDRWEERRNGVVRGAYSLLQPDGMVRSVDYEVVASQHPKDPHDKGSGFKAVVRYFPGPQKLLSSMTLNEMQADHPHPIVNTRALQGKDYDADQPKRKRLVTEMFGALREELKQGLGSRASRSSSTSKRSPRLMHTRYAAKHQSQ